jgi:hypothetical protein
MLGRKIVIGTSGNNSLNHVFAEFLLCAHTDRSPDRSPLDGSILNHDFIRPFPATATVDTLLNRRNPW